MENKGNLWKGSKGRKGKSRGMSEKNVVSKKEKSAEKVSRHENS